MKTPLWIEQAGEEDIKLHARYSTKPFTDSPYYAWRIARWKEDRAWELEFVHHKLYLENNPPEVQLFEITHGFNLLTVNRAWERSGFVYRLGAGVVITHSEITVRGKTLADGGIFDTGYSLSGPTAQAAVGKRFSLGDNVFFALEGKLTASYVRVRIAGGHADAPNAAVHGLFGLGFDF